MRSAPARASREPHEVVLGRVPRAQEGKEEVPPLGLPAASGGEDGLSFSRREGPGRPRWAPSTGMAVSTIRSMTAPSSASFESK